MIDTAALKTKILALAFQGKLTEQTSENARELFANVCEERDLLIKKKIIKKNKTKSITTDELKFEIPSNWIWVRLGDVINLQSGQDLTISDYNDKVQGVPYITGASNFRTDESLIINRWTETPKAIALEDDILLSVKGTVGKIAFLHEKKVHIARQIMGIRPIGLYRKYVKYFVQEQVEELKAISKGLIPGIERDNVLNMLMPMPPLCEQKIIVKKIEEAFKQLDTIDALQSQYSSDLEVLKSKIIDAGIQGKLTEQLPEDGNVEELLKQIAEEKKLLIKEKKIKVEKALPEIGDEEIPFEIPDNWKWVRVVDIGITSTGSTPTKTNTANYGGNYPFFKPSDLDAGNHISKASEYLSELGKEASRQFAKGTILVCCIGSIGKSAIIDEDGTANQQINAWTPIICDSDYLQFAIQSNFFKNQLLDKSRATTVSIIKKSKFDSCLVPLPPLDEQKRIVERIEAIVAMC